MSDYDKLKAGPELNALIAERVMGWVDGEAPRGYREDWRTQEGELLDKEECQFSTDIAAAWSVVEKMQSLEADVDTIGYDQGDYSCVISKEKPQSAGLIEWGGEEWEAETAPLAICRAALKAMANRALVIEA